jgi:hypothetical protein
MTFKQFRRFCGASIHGIQAIFWEERMQGSGSKCSHSTFLIYPPTSTRVKEHFLRGFYEYDQPLIELTARTENGAKFIPSSHQSDHINTE